MEMVMGTDMKAREADVAVEESVVTAKSVKQ